MADLFERTFGRAPTARGIANGRVNLMGDHTDYNGGYVLPVCIPQGTTVEIAGRSDGKVRVTSVNMNSEIREFNVDSLERTGDWTDYIKGVLSVSQGHFRISGFDALITSTVPVGAGLSSSAALEVALLRALQKMCGASLTDVQMALLGQKAENDFVGVPVGIMDQMAAAVGDEKHALFLDTRTMRFELVAIPREIAVVVIDSALPHAHAAGAYAKRRRECEAAAQLLNVHELRDAIHADDANSLPDPLRQRAYHVVTENARVLQMVETLKKRRFEDLSVLMRQSLESLRYDFEVSTPDIDHLAQLARDTAGVFGARMTGGGFGGCIVALAEKESARKCADSIVSRYSETSGRHAAVVVPA